MDKDDEFKKVNDDCTVGSISSSKKVIPEDTRVSKPFWPITPYLD